MHVLSMIHTGTSHTARILQMRNKMAFPTLKIINYSNIICPVILVALSITTIYWTREAIDYDFSARHYTPHNDLDNRPLVLISFDYLNINFVFAASGIALVAGLATLTAFFFTKAWTTLCYFSPIPRLTQIQNSKPSLLNNCLTNLFPFLAFVFSLLSIIITSIRHATIAKSTCHGKNGYAGEFQCTRELGACLILDYTTTPWRSGSSDITNLCVDLHRSRMMLIPLTVISTVVLGLGVARLVLE